MDEDTTGSSGAPQFGPFIAEFVLGRGATSTVWAARHLGTGHSAAVKEIHDPAWTGEEVRIAAGLSHPHIVRPYDLGRRSGGRPWVAMERASGGSLLDAPPKSWGAVLRALDDVLCALAHLHAHRFVHRDVKLGNLLQSTIADGATITRLGDFGIATSARGRSVAAGSVETLAPEQIRGDDKGLGPWTDLYAVGVVASQLVYGRLPYASTRPEELIQAHLYQPPDLAGPASFAVPDGLAALLALLLRKDPAARFQRAADVRAALRALGPPVGTDASRRTPLTPDGQTFGWTGSLEAPAATGGEEEDLAAPAPAPRAPWPDWRISRTAGRGPMLDAGLGLLALRRTPLVGREHEREALWGLLRRVETTGRAAVAVVSGGPGVGKTALVDWLTVRADEEGLALVARFDGAPATALAQTAGLSVAGRAAGIRRWLRRFGSVPDGLVEDVVAGVAAPADGPVGWWLRLAAHLGRTRPVLIVADRGHERIVEDVLRARPFVDGRWMFVSVEPDGPRAGAPLPDSWVSLDELPIADAVAVVDDQLPLAAGVAQALVDEADSLAGALRLLRAAGHEGRLLATPAGYRLGERVAARPEAPAWARGWAALGGSLSREEVADPEGWARARDAGWVRGSRLELPLDVARAVWSADPEGPQRTAAALAWWEAVGDRRREGLALAVAGQNALAVSRWIDDGYAGDDLEDGGRAERALTLAEARVAAGEVAAPPGFAVLRALVMRRAGNTIEALRVALAVGADPVAPARERARAWYGVAVIRSRGREDAADLASWTECHRWAVEAGELGLAAKARIRLVHFDGPNDDLHPALCREVAEHAPEQLAVAEFRHVALLAKVDPARARIRLREVLAVHGSTAGPGLQASLQNLRGVLATDLQEAAEAFEAAARSVEGSPAALVARANLGEILVRLGRWGEARQELRRVLAHVTQVVPLPWLQTSLHLHMAMVEAHDGDVDGAVEHLRAAGAALPESPSMRGEHARTLQGLAAGTGQVAEEARRWLAIVAPQTGGDGGADLDRAER